MNNAKQAKQTDGFTSSLGSLKALLNKDPNKEKKGDEVLKLAFDQVMEDPNQPRTEFDEEFLAWLAEDIRRKGVKSPISVRPGQNGQYVINHGANRLRASKLAGVTAIPAILDEQYDPYDQISENIKRKSLSPRDIALWIKKRMLGGESRQDVAKKLDVGSEYITRHLAITELPDEIIAMVYDTGICRGERTLYELQLCHKQDAVATRAFVQRIVEENGATVKEIQTFKKGLKANPKTLSDEKPSAIEDSSKKQNTKRAPARNEKPTDADEKFTNPIIKVKHGQEAAKLLIFKKPDAAGNVWIEYKNGRAGQVPTEQVTLDSIMEGKN